MILVLVCLLAHWSLANLWPSPWWLPDLTVAGMVVAVARAPDRWLGAALVASCAAGLWAVRDCGLIVCSMLAAGWIVRVCAEQWDLSGVWMLRLVAAAAATALQGLLLWVHDWWSWPLGAMWLVHAALTGAAAGVIAGFAAGRRVPEAK